jgi:tetratricopeptide (TPR) repeat protein
MKFFNFRMISLIILNYIVLGCVVAPSQISDYPSQTLSKFDGELFSRAISHQKKGQIEPAVVLWNRFLQKNPNSFAARNNLGLLYYANDQIEQAIYHFNQGYKLRPGAVELKKNLVRVLKVQAAIFEENREYDEAIMSLVRVVQLSPVKEQESIERQIEALEDRIFEQVKKSDSIREYKEFLLKYPHSPGNSHEARLWIKNRLQVEKMNKQESLFYDQQSSLKTEPK